MNRSVWNIAIYCIGLMNRSVWNNNIEDDVRQRRATYGPRATARPAAPIYVVRYRLHSLLT